MVQTASTMLELGAKAPDFKLTDTDGKTVSLSGFEGSEAYLVAFMCNHCPFVKHVRHEFARLAEEYLQKGVAVVAISSNDPEQYPDDGPEKMAEEKAAIGYKFPYLFDETQEVAKAYRAACTPEFYVFNADLNLAYRGQMDDSRPSNEIPVDGKDLRAAVDAVLAGTDPSEDQRPSIGCSIKWKPGNEPDYA